MKKEFRLLKKESFAILREDFSKLELLLIFQKMCKDPNLSILEFYESFKKSPKKRKIASKISMKDLFQASDKNPSIEDLAKEAVKVASSLDPIHKCIVSSGKKGTNVSFLCKKLKLTQSQCQKALDRLVRKNLIICKNDQIYVKESKASSTTKPKLKNQVIEILEEGPCQIGDLAKSLDRHPSHIGSSLRILVKNRTVEKIKVKGSKEEYAYRLRN